MILLPAYEWSHHSNITSSEVKPTSNPVSRISFFFFFNFRLLVWKKNKSGYKWSQTASDLNYGKCFLFIGPTTFCSIGPDRGPRNPVVFELNRKVRRPNKVEVEWARNGKWIECKFNCERWKKNQSTLDRAVVYCRGSDSPKQVRDAVRHEENRCSEQTRC